jgi:hypothetical protein
VFGAIGGAVHLHRQGEVKLQVRNISGGSQGEWTTNQSFLKVFFR